MSPAYVGVLTYVRMHFDPQMYDHMHTVCVNALVRVGAYVCRSVLPWHKSLELSRGLVLLSPSVSVCRGEVFYADDRANGGRRGKVSHACV